jgi:hypothetical protein
VQAKGIENTFNKIIEENFQILRKRCPFRYKRPLGYQTDMTKIEPLHSIIQLNNKHREQGKNTKGCKGET